MSVAALEERGLQPADGPVLVTGASGGVGGTALAILADRGYEVWAATGKPDEADRLRGLGAAGILTRDEVTAAGKPLESERWAGAVDAVGAATLPYVLRTLRTGAAVAASGNASGPKLDTTVFPFILRGVALLGMDSAQLAIDRRRAIWDRLATDLRPRSLGEHVTEVDARHAGRCARRDPCRRGPRPLGRPRRRLRPPSDDGCRRCHTSMIDSGRVKTARSSVRPTVDDDEIRRGHRPRCARVPAAPSAAAPPIVAARSASIGDRPASARRSSSLADAPGGRCRSRARGSPPRPVRAHGLERLLQLPLRLLDERRREVGREPLRQVVERREGRDEHRASRRHRVEERRVAVERQAVLDRVGAGLDRPAVPARPSACAATRRPIRCASSTIAVISSSVIWAGSGSSATTDRAPVAMNLMKSAPRRICSRTALRISHGPSASRYIVPKITPPGAVADTIRPHVRMRGPGTTPRSTASFSALASSSKLPTSRTVVKPGPDDPHR